MNGVGSIHSTLQTVKNLGKVTASAYSSQEEPSPLSPNSRVMSQGNMTLRLGPLGPWAPLPPGPQGVTTAGSTDPPKAPEEQGLTTADLFLPSLHSFPISLNRFCLLLPLFTTVMMVMGHQAEEAEWGQG